MAISRIAEKIFAAFLRLYPSGFQTEFGLEIRGVFSESVQQAERQGVLPALAVSLREVGDFPINLINEYWEEYHMQNLQLSQPVIRPVWWGAIGFGLSAALINTFNSVMYLLQPDMVNTPASYWYFWGELLGHLVVGGLGGLVFALICRQPAKAKLYFIAGSLGFLIGHLLWYPIMVGSSILLFYSNPNDATNLIANITVRWIDLVLMVGLTGLFIGWMGKSLPLAFRLAGSGVLGAALGGLLGLGVCGVILLIGSSSIGRVAMITNLIFMVNALAGIFGGALLGRAIVRGDIREAPNAA